MIKVGDYQVTDEDKKSIMEVLESGRLSEGKKVREFEARWAEYIGTKYCVLTNSGTSALILALYTVKMIDNSVRTVLTTPLTFIATINAIVLSGLHPEFIDVDRETFVITPETIGNTKADIFLPVHLYGYPVDMDRINCAKYTIQDACEAHGTIYNGRKIGSTGNMGCFSFYIAHNIQVGDMGAITTNDKEIYKFLNKAKAHGRMCECPLCQRSLGKCPHKGQSYDPRFTFTDIAYNFKTSEFQATLGINQVKQADSIIKKRFNNVLALNCGLHKYKKVLQLPILGLNVSYLAYPIVVKKPELITRDELRIELEAKGIETRPLFSCVPNYQPAYSFMKGKQSFPNADWLSENGLHIGCHQYLTDDDIKTIINAFDEILG